MRVERFSLFFPPLLLRKQVGETEYALGSIPLGGYVKISGMNPDEDLPDEVRTRAYHAQPVWKRVTVIAAGPAVNLIIAFLLLFVFFFADRARDHEQGRRGDRARLPGRGRAPSGRPPGGRGRARRRLRGALQADRLAQVRRGPAHAPLPATEPVQLTVVRDGERKQIRLTPIYDPRTERTRLGFSYAPGPREDLSFGERPQPDGRPVLVHHQGDGRPSGPSDQPRHAQADLRRRGLLRGHPSDDPQRAWLTPWRSSRSSRSRSRS